MQNSKGVLAPKRKQNTEEILEKVRNKKKRKETKAGA